MEGNEKAFSCYWNTLNEGIPDQVVSAWRERISTNYRESQRYYHTLQHVMDMKRQKEVHLVKLQRPKLVDYAIIFHDVVYEPQKQDNEERSADLFSEFAADGELCESDKQLVMDWILLTKTHSTPEHLTESEGVGDKHYFLDLDMAILGSTPQIYQEYASNIRKEYIHIPHKEYCTKRAQLLSTFLQTPRIYATREFHELYEEQARSNVNDEIAKLLQSATTTDE